MQSISAAEVKRSFGAALEAARQQPVLIHQQSRYVAVILSVRVFDKLRGLPVKAFDDIADAIAVKAAAKGMTDELCEHLLSDIS